MSTQTCLIQDCGGKTYAPAGTGSVCKNHFSDFLKWRRRKGHQMFTKYAAMTMEERDTVAQEWKNTVFIEK